MITNLNVRVLGNGYIFVQYHKDGKANDAAFPNWEVFLSWLRLEVTLEVLR